MLLEESLLQLHQLLHVGLLPLLQLLVQPPQTSHLPIFVSLGTQGQVRHVVV